jgi:hypothetical protein
MPRSTIVRFPETFEKAEANGFGPQPAAQVLLKEKMTMKKEIYSADLNQPLSRRHGRYARTFKRVLLGLAIAGVAASSSGCLVVRDDQGHHHWRWHHEGPPPPP